MKTIDDSMNGDTYVISGASNIINKALKGVNDEVPTRSDSTETPIESVMWGEVDLCNLGGFSDAEKCKNIAEALFSMEELKHICIDPKRKPTVRQPADSLRTVLFRRACRIVLGENYSEKNYRYALSLINQKGPNDMSNPKRNNGNINIVQHY